MSTEYQGGKTVEVSVGMNGLLLSTESNYVALARRGRLPNSWVSDKQSREVIESEDAGEILFCVAFINGATKLFEIPEIELDQELLTRFGQNYAVFKAVSIALNLENEFSGAI